jgi:saccharopine dehydrogenase (NAD+, L-lysine forming)
MGRVLIIGAGGVGTVVAHKIAQRNEVFSDILLASRTKSKCDDIAKAIGGDRIKTAAVDAENVKELVSLINSFKPDLVVNVALPYQDLPIMDACLEARVSYLDTANYEPRKKLSLNTVGNGLTRKSLKQQVLQPFWVAGSTRA